MLNPGQNQAEKLPTLLEHFRDFFRNHTNAKTIQAMYEISKGINLINDRLEATVLESDLLIVAILQTMGPENIEDSAKFITHYGRRLQESMINDDALYLIISECHGNIELQKAIYTHCKKEITNIAKTEDCSLTSLAQLAILLDSIDTTLAEDFIKTFEHSFKKAIKMDENFNGDNHKEIMTKLLNEELDDLGKMELFEKNLTFLQKNKTEINASQNDSSLFHGTKRKRDEAPDDNLASKEPRNN